MKSTLLIITLLLSFNVRANRVERYIESLEELLQVDIVHDTIVEDSWDAITYNVPADSAFLLQYLDWLSREFSKYPEGYLKRASVQTIALCTDLHYAGQNRAAVPDPYRTTLFLAVDGAYDDSTEMYLVHVMHHELHHCAEYSLWNSMTYRWKTWKKTNRCLFRYKGAGAQAYDDLSISWYAMVHPRKGFVNLYSTTAQEEDRSEIVALMMSDIERELLIGYSEKDKRLRKKIELAVGMLNRLCGVEENYWGKVMGKIR